jgi:hypothetical protein
VDLLSSRSMTGELLFQEARLRLDLHDSPPPGFVDLLSRAVWGTGAVRYGMLDFADRVHTFEGSHFLALSEDGQLVGTYAFAPRTLHLGERTVPAFYRTLLAVAPGRSREGLGWILVREARRHFLAAAAGPLVTYGFVEAENTASVALASRAGHERWGSFLAVPLTRWSPPDDPRAEPLDAAELPALLAQLEAAYRGFVRWDFPRALAVAPCFVIRGREGAIVAAAQLVPRRWRLEELSGPSGFVVRRVLPRLGMRRLLDPDDLRFAFFGGLYAAPGHERDLARLLDALLARSGLHAGLMYLDPRAGLYLALREHGGLGLLHALGVRPLVHIMVSAVGLPAAELQAARARPLCHSMQDDV